MASVKVLPLENYGYNCVSRCFLSFYIALLLDQNEERKKNRYYNSLSFLFLYNNNLEIELNRATNRLLLVTTLYVVC